jgi:hypothetical protein
LNQSKAIKEEKFSESEILEAPEEKDQGGKVADICRKWGISIVGAGLFSC